MHVCTGPPRETNHLYGFIIQVEFLTHGGSIGDGGTSNAMAIIGGTIMTEVNGLLSGLSACLLSSKTETPGSKEGMLFFLVYFL